MAGSFVRRSRELEHAVGDGALVMGAVVGQPYAASEHNKKYKHPRGGGPGYLTIPFEAERDEMLETLAAAAITPNGSELQRAAVEVAGRFATMVERNAPVEFETLRNSTSTYVEDDGRIVHMTEQKAPYRKDKD